jgi:histidinol-phosphate aminotransferase
MKKFWSDCLKNLNPYTPGEQPKEKIELKLNTNENPYPPTQLVNQAICTNGSTDLNLYPDPESDDLRDVIADYHKLFKEQVFVGNGSDEILAFIFYAFFKDKESVLFPDITYSFYPVYAKLFEINYQTIPLDENFKINLDSYASNNSAIIFPNPNAPTSIALSRNEIELFLKNHMNSIVVIDEAYVDFGTETALPLLEKYNNIIITRSMSKSRSLAGLRVGYALGSANLIEGLMRVKNSFNSYPLDRLAQKASIASFKDEEYFLSTCNQIVQTRNNFVEALKALKFSALQPSGNFVLAKPPKTIDAKSLYLSLKDKGILVRYFPSPVKISSYIRITIGTKEQMEKLISEIKKILS